jgi:twitching motility two-component system response regulator PilG
LNKPFLVDVIGFNPVERSMLTSIFALAVRRDPGFVQFDPASGASPDIYLVDADSPEAMGEFQSLNKRGDLRAVLVGTAPEKTGSIVLARPLQWARLLQAMEDTAADLEPDLMLGDSLDSIPQGASLPFGRSRPGATRADGPVSSQAARKRALGDTVLVVDDNATVRLFMKAKLAPFGFEVDYAETGEEAVGLTGTQEYTCVFLDVVLPGIDGYQVCKMIKSNKQAIKKTAVVMLTSRNSPFDKLRGSLAGCDEYLTKPLDEDRLLEVIAKFLPSSRKRERSRSK